MRLPSVYDTNVLVSGTLIPGSIPSSLIALALHGSVQLYLSPAIAEEYREVLLRPKFGFRRDAVHTFLSDLKRAAIMVHPTLHLTNALDEPDNRFLECAVAAKAEYLVTGNKSDFPFQKFRGTRIVSPAEFAAILIE
jgi:uncharacterized protein